MANFPDPTGLGCPIDEWHPKMFGFSCVIHFADDMKGVSTFARKCLS